MVRPPGPSLGERVRGARLTRVLAVYLSASFIVLQVADIFTDQLGLPDWFFPGALALLVLGLPIVVTTAIVQTALPARGAAPLEIAGAEEIDLDRGKGASLTRRWFTWRRTLIGGLIGFAVLVLGVAAYMATRALGIGPAGSLVAAGVLEEREPLLVADFRNRTRDPSLGAIVTEAFRVDLAQSPLVTVVPPATVRQALARMERPPTSTLDEDLAREMAQREGIKAVLAGDVGSAGRGYLLSARLIDAHSGAALAAFRSDARDSTGLVESIDQLSGKVRERVGESLKRIRASEPLASATTSSLVALRKYSMAVRILDTEADITHATALLQEAVGVDPSFAMAWRKLGTALLNTGDRRGALEAFRHAFENRQRLTDRERYLTLGSYYTYVTGELDKAAAAYKSLLDTYPGDTWALNNLGLIYRHGRELARAESAFTRAIVVDSLAFTAYVNLVDVRVDRGEWEPAERAMERLRSLFPHNLLVPYKAFELAMARGDHARAAAELETFAATDPESPLVRATAERARGLLAALRGREALAERSFAATIAASEERELPGQALRAAIRVAQLRVWVIGDSTTALAGLDSALAIHPLAQLDPLDRPYLDLGTFYALARRPARARAALDVYEKEVPAEQRRMDEDHSRTLRGLILEGEGKHAEAAAELAQAAASGACPICPLPILGLAFEGLELPDSAAAVYERYVATPYLERYEHDPLWLPWVYERLGRLAAEKGDAERAAGWYARFVELWKDADPALQPRVEAARGAIRQLEPMQRR